MSVILDALHKARGDKRGNSQNEPHPNSVARVLDANADTAAHPVSSAPPPTENHPSAGRTWLVASAVMFGLICLLVLIGGAFFLLYDQVRRIDSREYQPTVVASAPVASGTTTPPNGPAAHSPLPTPMPLSELPIQPPAPANASQSATNTAVTPRPKFKLGSIVCEKDDCIASLNGRSVRVGDEVQQYRVVNISANKISLKSVTGNDVMTLSLF